MPLPGDVNVVVVEGTFTDMAGNPVGGSVTFTPSVSLSNTAGMLVIPAVGRQYMLQGGKFTSDPLAATDNSSLAPAGWTYSVVVAIENIPGAPITFQVFLPSSPSTVDFSDLQPVYPVAGYAEFLALSGGTLTGPLYASEAPVSSMEVATKAYVDAVSQGLSQKPTVQEATTAALPSNTYASGVLTAASNGALTVDGIAVVSGDRVLVKNESATANNGIYLCSATGSAGAKYVLTRASDMNTGSQVPGAYTLVEQGTANAGTGWMVSSPGPFTLGTTSIAWTEFGAGAVVAGTGITKTGNTLSVTAPVTVALGGTNAITAAAALASLGAPALAGDLSGTSASPTVVSTHLASALPVAQGGTNSTSQNWTGLLTPTSVQTSGAVSASAGQLVRTNTTSNSITVTLPNAPAANTIVGVKQVQQSGAYTTTVACAGSDVFSYTGSGVTTSVLRLPGQGEVYQYASGVWAILSDALPLTQLDSRYLTVAGEPVTVAQGGTGDVSLSAYAVLAGGTTSTGALQQVSGLGGSTQVLTSNGAAALPTWQNSASGFSNPMTTAGDLILGGAAGAAGRLAVGASGQAVTSNGTTAGWSAVSGQYLRSPNVYAPGTLATCTVSTTTLAAFSSGNICTGSFTAPASGSVVVTASFVVKGSAGTFVTIALAASGTVTPVTGYASTFELSAVNHQPAFSAPFVVTGLTSGTSYNFDLLGAVQANSASIVAIGQSSTTQPGASEGPAVMTVQAV